MSMGKGRPETMGAGSMLCQCSFTRGGFESLPCLELRYVSDLPRITQPQDHRSWVHLNIKVSAPSPNPNSSVHVTLRTTMGEAGQVLAYSHLASVDLGFPT